MKKSAGILLYRINPEKSHEVFLVHPGGPFWIGKDAAAWSVPKGEFSEDEDPLLAAQREFEEETGMRVSGDFIPLKALKQSSGKLVYVWLLKGDVDADKVKSNDFELEWPPHSGIKKQFPEVDKAGWFSLSEAREKIHKGQQGFIDEFERCIGNL